MMNDAEGGADVCECPLIHEDVVRKVRAALPPDELLFSLGDFFKMFADSTRIKIIYALVNAEMCVCDIAALLTMSASAVSHQLRSLRQTRLVKYRRDGKIVYYSLDDGHIRDILTEALAHIKEEL